MTDLQTISVVITATSVVVALSYYILNIRNINQTRQAQLFMQIHSQWNDREFVEQFMDLLNLWEWRDPDDFWNRYGQRTNLEAYISLTSILWYFEGVGVLLKNRLVNINLIDALYSDRYVRFWEKFEPILQDLREDFDNPNYYQNGEYLHDELKKHQKLALAGK